MNTNTTPAPKPTKESLEEKLKKMSEEERLAFLQGMSNERQVQYVLKLIQGFLPANEWGAFSAKYQSIQNTKNNQDPSENFLAKPGASTPKPAAEANIDQSISEEDAVKKIRALQAASSQNPQAASVLSLFPSLFPARQAKAKPSSSMGYKSDFAQYESQFDIGNRKMLHDAESSVPHKGQVMSLGQIDFSIKQGDKLEGLLKEKGVSLLNASPADQSVLKRASAARHEAQLQALERSESAMISAEQKLSRSIESFRNGALGKALPDLMAAKNPADIGAALNTAASKGLLDRNAMEADIQSIGKNFIDYGAATEKHAKNLVKADQEDAAQGLVEQFSDKVKKFDAKGFLSAIKGEEFGEQLKEMSKKIGEAIAAMIKGLFSRQAA